MCSSENEVPPMRMLDTCVIWAGRDLKKAASNHNALYRNDIMWRAVVKHKETSPLVHGILFDIWPPHSATLVKDLAGALDSFRILWPALLLQDFERQQIATISNCLFGMYLPLLLSLLYFTPFFCHPVSPHLLFHRR